jgi:hypothetical protein
LRAIFVLDLFYLLLVQLGASAGPNPCAIEGYGKNRVSESMTTACNVPSFGDLTGQHVLKLKATLITILQGSLCGL